MSTEEKLQPNLTTPQIEVPLKTKFFVKNNTVDWDVFQEIPRIQQAIQWERDTKIETGLNKMLKSKKLPCLTSPKNSEKSFIQNWSTLKSRKQPPSRGKKRKEAPFSPNLRKQWKRLKTGLFASQNIFFVQKRTPSEKAQNFKDTVQKLERKKLKRSNFRPEFTFQQAFDFLRRPMKKQQQKCRPRLTSKPMKKTRPTTPKQATRTQQPQPHANEDRILNRLSASLTKRTIISTIKQLSRHLKPVYDNIPSSMPTTQARTKIYLEAHQRKALEEKFEDIPKENREPTNKERDFFWTMRQPGGYSDEWGRPDGLLLFLQLCFSSLYPIVDGTHYYPFGFDPEIDIDIFTRIRLVHGCLILTHLFTVRN